MVNQASQVACTCGGCIAYYFNNMWISVALAVLLAIAISLDFYHIAQRCKERQIRYKKLLEKKEARNGCCKSQ